MAFEYETRGRFCQGTFGPGAWRIRCFAVVLRAPMGTCAVAFARQNSGIPRRIGCLGGRLPDQDPGVLVHAPVETVAVAIWGQVHGIICLELAQKGRSDANWAAVYRAALDAIASGWAA